MPKTTNPAGGEALPEFDIEALAALEFEPWQHEPGEWAPPTDEEWAALCNPHLVMIRIAWLVMFKSKQDLIDGISCIGSPDEYDNMVNRVGATSDFFEGILEILKAASLRMMSARVSTLSDAELLDLREQEDGAGEAV